MFIINVIAETESGIKLLRTIAKAAPLPTEIWLGNIKKNAAATMAVPTVIIANSLIVLQNFMSFSSCVFEVILHYTSFFRKRTYIFLQKLN